jgi:hypothetical protein
VAPAAAARGGERRRWGWLVAIVLAAAIGVGVALFGTGGPR